MVTEMKEMLDAAYNESAMSQPCVYCWHNEFKNGRKCEELMGGLSTPMTALTEQ